MGTRGTLVFLLLLVITEVYTQAQGDTVLIQELDEVVVSDSRFELKRENSGKTVITIGADILERNPGVSVASLLNQYSGIEIGGSRSRQGEVLGVFARGGRGRQVLVLLDGVRVADPSSFSQEFDLRLLSTTDIASIEIIKGAASTLYGTNAAAAVINIRTRESANNPLSGVFQSQMGTNQTASDQNYRIARFNQAARISGTLNGFTYAVGLSHEFANGLSSLATTAGEEDPFSRVGTSLRLGYKAGKNFSFTLYGQEQRLRNDYDETFGFSDAPYQFVSRQLRTGITSSFSYRGGNLNFNAAYSEYDSENLSAFPSAFKGDNLIMDLYNRYTLGKNVFTALGINYSEDRALSQNTEQITQFDPYFNLVYVSGKGWNINTGARFNQHSQYGNHLVYTINPSYRWRLNKGYLRVLTSYSTSFIAPSLPQLFGEFGANPDLQPETNRTLEAGLELAFPGKIRSSVVFFNRKEQDAVIFNNSTFQYFNADSEVAVSGLELEIDWQATEQIRLNGNYTFTERKGDNAIRIPKHKWNLNLGYQVDQRLFAQLSGSFTGDRRDTDFNTFSDVPLDRFFLLGMQVSYELLPNRLKVYLQGENLGNSRFEEVLGFTIRGRNLAFGFQFKL